MGHGSNAAKGKALQLWALNGLGTKGYSISPYFAHQLVQTLLGNGKLDKEVDLKGR